MVVVWRIDDISGRIGVFLLVGEVLSLMDLAFVIRLCVFSFEFERVSFRSSPSLYLEDFCPMERVYHNIVTRLLYM
jgi:hypothetical protein